MGYSHDLFIDTNINDEFLCPICQDVLEQVTMLDPCEHVFCKSCIESWATNSKTCPIDRKYFIDYKKPQRIYLNLLNNLELHCPFKQIGCTEITKLGELPTHDEKCVFNPENHKECSGGCGAVLTQYEKRSHSCVSHLKEQLLVAKAKIHEYDLKYGKLSAESTEATSISPPPVKRAKGLDPVELRSLPQPSSTTRALPAPASTRTRKTYDHNVAAHMEQLRNQSSNSNSAAVQVSSHANIVPSNPSANSATILPSTSRRTSRNSVPTPTSGTSSGSPPKVSYTNRKNLSEILCNDIIQVVTNEFTETNSTRPTSMSVKISNIREKLKSKYPGSWTVDLRDDNYVEYGIPLNKSRIDVNVNNFKLLIWKQ